MSVVTPLLDLIQKEMKQSSPEWRSSSMKASEWRELDEEVHASNEFDRLNRRADMFDQWVQQKLRAVTKECDHGKITVVMDHGQSEDEIPWEIWGRILRMYAPGPFRIYVLGHSSRRQFPASVAEPILPEHINGGYTYPCKKNQIILYRAEDATRVLIHELMHASCLDNPSSSIDQIEAETEAWAEWIYVALLSRGNPLLFNQFLQRQSSWMQLQNRRVRKHLSQPFDFPWRYTLGKQEVWKRWGILRPLKQDSTLSLDGSLRLTAPPTRGVKQSWKVRWSSVYL